MFKLFSFSILFASILLPQKTFAMDEMMQLLSGLRASHQPEKSPEQIIAESKHQLEFMGCDEWLKKQKPRFSLEKYKNNPLFPCLEQAMQLADFEVDTIVDFIGVYMTTDMPQEQGESMLTLRGNSMTAKNLVSELVDLLEGKTTIQDVAQNYFKDRLFAVVEYQAALIGKQKTLLDMSRVESVQRVTQSDSPTGKLLKDGFMRSYNTRLIIMRNLLYHLKSQNPKPLTEQLPEHLVKLLRISQSLHPFLNNETDNWIDYDVAARCGEGRNFAGNGSELEINMKSELQKRGVKRFPTIPLRPISELPQPTFLLEEKVTTDVKRKKRKKKGKGKATQLSTATVLSEVALPTEVIESSLVPSIALPTIPEVQPIKPTTEQAVLISDSLSHPELKEKIADVESIPTSPLIEEKPSSSQTVVVQPTPKTESVKVSTKHAGTIHDIFSPSGYKSLNDNKIIAAWEHILEGRGFLKQDTGRSHQPLYATLTDGTRVVLGLFRSSGYGPHYMKYIREAFEKIGFGKDWLKAQGYKLN